MLLPFFFLLLAAKADPQDLVRAGVDAMASGDLARARRDLETAAGQAPNDPRVYLLLTQLYARAKEEKPRMQAAAHAVDLAHATPNWESEADIRNYLGKVYLANAEFSKALSEYREAIRLSPYEESYRFDLAQALLGREQFPEAVDALEDARKIFDKSAQIELALGVAYYGQRRFPEAVDAFLRTVNLAPEVIQPYVFLGRMIDQAGDRLPEVEQRFSQFEEANPRSYMAHLLLAKAIAVRGGSPEQQLALLRKSIALKPDYWESHYELGVFYENARDFPQAAAELERSAQLNPDIAETHYHLGRVYDRMDRVNDAAKQREIHNRLLSHEKLTAGMEPVR